MKKVRKGVLWMLVILMVTSAVPGIAFAQPGSGERWIDVKKVPSGKTGQNMTINMVLTNQDDIDLTNVAIRFEEGLANQESDAKENGEEYSGSIFPFEITSSTFDNKKVGNIKSGSSKSVTLTGMVRRDIADGYYSVPIEIVQNATVKNDGSPVAHEKVNIWITKSSATTESGKDEGTIQFELGENQNTPFGIYPQVMNFNMNVRNSSQITAFDVNVRMKLDQDSTKFPFDINDGNYTRHYDRIGGGETVEIPYSMNIRKDVYSGYYPITYTIEYRDSTDGDIQKVEETFYVKVQNKDKEEETGDFNANDRTKARIIVDGFETNPETVYAGEEFEMILHMKNASENVAASNILFNLESEKVTESAVFTMDSGSSSIVVNSLPAGQTTDIKLKLRAGAWVDQRTYSITINEKYDSPEFKNAEEKVTVNIPVKQVSRLNTGTIEIMPDTISVGSETNVMFPINNTGKVLLYNVMVAFVGDSIQQTNSYVGNIKPGESGNVDAMISGTAPTMDDGKIKVMITYEDENGVVSEPIEKELSLTVTEQEDLDPGMDGSGDFPVVTEPEGTSKYGKIIIPAVIVVLVIGTIGTVYVLKKRKKKKETLEELEEENNNEI
ncbi:MULTISPECIES: COG1361 S-layer family protein [unclassified Lacrimispora]|uniref:COG1361 S-layer family protein n=1 Tax=unclassified Lacrimispora TaxID=2719232 RepID=UPI0037701F28